MFYHSSLHSSLYHSHYHYLLAINYPRKITIFQDIVLLCQLRDAPLVLKPFIHPTTRGLLRKLATHLGNGFQLMEISKTSTGKD